MRLIDADALEELFREVIGGIAKEPEMTGNLEHMIRASATVVQMIQDAPTVERAEIVRCRECKYMYEDDQFFCGIRGFNVNEEFFCADGVKRDGE